VFVKLMHLSCNEKKTGLFWRKNESCQNRRELRFDASIQEFDIHVNVTLSHCFIPTGGSKKLADILQFNRRHR
jgi:hypothetical protein